MTGIAFVGETFQRSMVLNGASIARFAQLCGDTNPLHHDRDYATRTRFRGIIASAPHYTSLFMGMIADHYARKGGTVGLEFAFSYRVAVAEDDPLEMRWEVAEVLPKASLDGDIVTLHGTIANARGQVAVTAQGKILVWCAN